jgi:hypothetical protein
VTASASLIVYGPQGCGKTLHSGEIAQAFELGEVLEEPFPLEEAPKRGALILTHFKPTEREARGFRVLPFDQALRVARGAAHG